MSINVCEEEGVIASSPLTEANIRHSLEDYIIERYGESSVQPIKDFISEDTRLNRESGVGGFSYPVREIYKGVIYQDPERVTNALDFLVAITNLSNTIKAKDIIWPRW